MLRIMYHTQESRDRILIEPIPCVRDDAWLGEASYFWLSEDDADMWGRKSKRATGYFEIYKSEINCELVLDTVFNEGHYYFWLDSIEKAAKAIIKKTRCKPTLKELNDYLIERGNWSEVDGIMFQDLPTNDYYSLIQPIIRKENRKEYFAYKKRIQLALYNEKKILSFNLLHTKSCN